MFQIGDRVRAVYVEDFLKLKGKEGIVIRIQSNICYVYFPGWNKGFPFYSIEDDFNIQSLSQILILETDLESIEKGVPFQKGDNVLTDEGYHYKIDKIIFNEYMHEFYGIDLNKNIQFPLISSKIHQIYCQHGQFRSIKYRNNDVEVKNDEIR